MTASACTAAPSGGRGGPAARVSRKRWVELVEGLSGLVIDQRISKAQSVRRAKPLEGLGIVAELTGQKKNRSFSYRAYVDLLGR